MGKIKGNENKKSKDNKNKDNKSYSRNQFWIRVALVIIVNLVLVIIWLFTERTDSNFISHFSFASTVTSIILSVLAIFMSVSGELKTQTIRDRIEQEAEEITKLTNSLESQMEKLSGKIEIIERNTDNIYAVINEHPETPPLSEGWKAVPLNSAKNN